MSRRGVAVLRDRVERARGDAFVVRADDDAGALTHRHVPGRVALTRCRCVPQGPFARGGAAAVPDRHRTLHRPDAVAGGGACHRHGQRRPRHPGARLRRRHALARRVSRRPRGSPEEARRVARDPAQQEALLRGDADGDLVADASDQCPKTPAGAPTDARGCPVRVPQAQRRRARSGAARDAGGGAHPVQQVLRRCAAAAHSCAARVGPRPADCTGQHGFNLAVAKVAGQPAGVRGVLRIQFASSTRTRAIRRCCRRRS